MANISNVKQNVGLVRNSYRKFLALGEGATSDDFKMTIEGYPDLEFLIQATQIPPLEREVVEGYGPHGVQFNQQGRYKNYQEVPITFKEVISGKVYQALRAMVREKKYLKISLGLICESDPQSKQHISWTCEDAWITLEGADLSVEDNTLIKPNGTIHANWVSHVDSENNSLSW